MNFIKFSIVILILLAIWGCSPRGKTIPEPAPAVDSSPEMTVPPEASPKATQVPVSPATPADDEDPAITKLLLEEGKGLASQEKFNEAIDRFNQVIIDDPQMIEAYVAKARSHEGLEEFDDAVTAYEEALKQAPQGRGEFQKDGIRHHLAMILYRKWRHTGSPQDKTTARDYLDEITDSGVRGSPDLVKLYEELKK